MLAGDRQISNERVSREGQRSGTLRDDVLTTQALLVGLSLSSSMGVEGEGTDSWIVKEMRKREEKRLAGVEVEYKGERPGDGTTQR